MKTYLLMPNFTTHRDGTVQLGNLVADPLRPFKPLRMPSAPVKTTTHTDVEFSLSSSATRSHEAGAWATFLQVASATLKRAVDASELEDYTADKLETVTLEQDPTDEQATELSRESRVSRAMEGTYGHRPVFMITGIKVAKGFRRTNQRSGTKQGEVGGEVPVNETLSLGGKFAASNSNSRTESATSTSDIVFAYQLHRISVKGWPHRIVSADVYAPKAALLGRKDAENTNEQTEQFDVSPASLGTLMEIAKQNEDSVYVHEIMEMGENGVYEKCVYVALE